MPEESLKEEKQPVPERDFIGFIYPQARMFAFEGHVVRRHGWPECHKVRTWKDSDADFIGLQNPDVLVLDCLKPCDCRLGAFTPTKEDEYAQDWEIVKA